MVKKTKLAVAMSEVHKNIPSTVKRTKLKGAKKEAMLRAIAFAKARKAGAHIPKVGGSYHIKKENNK